jgi:hypothetical protein
MNGLKNMSSYLSNLGFVNVIDTSNMWIIGFLKDSFYKIKYHPNVNLLNSNGLHQVVLEVQPVNGKLLQFHPQDNGDIRSVLTTLV